MKTVAGAIVLGVVLILAGAVFLSEARLLRRLAADEQRLATLDYEEEEDDTTATLMDRLALPFSSRARAETQRAAATYWRARYEALTPLTGVTGERPASDANVLLIAANAAYRSSSLEFGSQSAQRAAVNQLDSVIQAYADVLRADPASIDAAYNYEYVSRIRDTIARGRQIPRPKETAVALSDDLPIGPTVHGRPGSPPPEVPNADFKTYSPLQADERGDLMETEREGVTRRKG